MEIRKQGGVSFFLLFVCSLAQQQQQTKVFFIPFSSPQQKGNGLVERRQHGRQQDLVLVEAPHDVKSEVAEGLLFVCFLVFFFFLKFFF